jgi:hypothetical protein
MKGSLLLCCGLCEDVVLLQNVCDGARAHTADVRQFRPCVSSGQVQRYRSMLVVNVFALLVRGSGNSVNQLPPLLQPLVD